MDTLLFYKIIVMLKKHGSRNSCAGTGGSPIKKIKTPHPALSPTALVSRDLWLRGSPPLSAPSHLPLPESQAAAASTFPRVAPTPSSEWAQRRFFFVAVS